MRVAWIGLGNMGQPMAGHVLAAGHDVAAYDVRRAPVDAASALGARPATSPGDAATDAEAVCVAVLDEPQVEAVTTGPDGVFATARPGTIVAVHSTVRPATVRRVAAAAPDGVTVVDAPISGGVHGARAGTLCVMVGGPDAAFTRIRPVLDAVGDLVVHLGALGAGLAAKLARNLVGYVTMLGAQEGRSLAAAAGTDPDALARILEHTGTLSPMMRDLLGTRGGDAVYADDLTPLIDLAAKDLRAALALGADLDVALPAAALTLDRVAFAMGGEEPA
jgi:3-hydroxyisobutyrate dehydrogenase-like beta-hydroxyacid dehydrogenase